MALFEFELDSVEDIVPWGAPESPSLSWFALTYGRFWMPVGDQVLFEYSDEILRHWETQGHQTTRNVRTADYQIAAFAREMLGSVAVGTARLPDGIERLASDWNLLTALRKETYEVDDGEDARDLADAAWRWLGERSPWTSYLVACPNFQFVRVGDELRIHWDNRDRAVDGISVWTAQVGVLAMPVESFVEECRHLAQRLLSEMDLRIEEIAAGIVKARTPVSAQSLREQHFSWRVEFARYFAEYQTDIDWAQAERALRLIAERKGLAF